MDLLDGVPPHHAMTQAQRRALQRRWAKKRGHYGRPGTGPEGETCRTCAHYCSVSGGSRSYPKCGRARSAWTRGAGSDIRAKDPACHGWADKQKG